MIWQAAQLFGAGNTQAFSVLRSAPSRLNSERDDRSQGLNRGYRLLAERTSSPFRTDDSVDWMIFFAKTAYDLSEGEICPVFACNRKQPSYFQRRPVDLSVFAAGRLSKATFLSVVNEDLSGMVRHGDDRTVRIGNHIRS